MTSLPFNNSSEFKSFTSRVCGHLEKTKLNQLRHAIAKELGYPYITNLYDQLDSNPGAIDWKEILNTDSAKSLQRPDSLYNGMRVIVCAGEKGGTGRSTLAKILSYYAAEGLFGGIKRKVLAIDLCSQGNLSSCLLEMESVPNRLAKIPRARPEYISDSPSHEGWDGRSYSSSIFLDQPCIPYRSPHSTNLDCLPSYQDEYLLGERASSRIKDKEFNGLCESLKSYFSNKELQDTYDIVVIDISCGSNALAEAALSVCTDSIYALIPEVLGIEGLARDLKKLESINESRVMPINCAGIFMNKFMDTSANYCSLGILNKKYSEKFDIGDAIIHDVLPLRHDIKKADEPGSDGISSLPQSKSHADIMKILDAIHLRMFGTS